MNFIEVQIQHPMDYDKWSNKYGEEFMDYVLSTEAQLHISCLTEKQIKKYLSIWEDMNEN